MAKRTASAVWEGTLREGNGKVKLGSGAFEGQYSFASRFEEGTGTNPEELIGAAHAGCFSMALAAGLTKAGHKPTRVSTNAQVSLEKVGEGFKITTIELDTEGECRAIEEITLLEFAEAPENCRTIAGAYGSRYQVESNVGGAEAWPNLECAVGIPIYQGDGALDICKGVRESKAALRHINTARSSAAATIPANARKIETLPP
jgi:osmotically inducible protein OsmC